jgi:hypothetical protein
MEYLNARALVTRELNRSSLKQYTETAQVGKDTSPGRASQQRLAYFPSAK